MGMDNGTRAKAVLSLASNEMPQAIWGLLPEDLLDRILALLPLHQLLLLRSTCKRFNALLLSPAFLSQYHSRNPRAGAAYFIFFHPQFSQRFLPLYDSSADLWHKLPISISSSYQLLSSSSGLLCFSLSNQSTSLLVCNLLSLSSKIISSPIQSFCSATLISSPSSSPHGYKIFLPDSSSPTFFLYDSESCSWTTYPLFMPLLSLSKSHQTPVLFKGLLYFTTNEPFSIVGFDLKSRSWKTNVAPVVPPELAFLRLVSSGEGKKLYLIGGVGSNGISRSLKVWELVEEEEQRWEDVGRLPDMMCRKFVSVCYHNYSHVYCLWHQGMLCVCCTTWPEVLFFRTGRGTWHWLPKCPLLQQKWSCGFRWFSFAPNLYAMV